MNSTFLREDHKSHWSVDQLTDSHAESRWADFNHFGVRGRTSENHHNFFATHSSVSQKMYSASDEVEIRATPSTSRASPPSWTPPMLDLSPGPRVQWESFPLEGRLIHAPCSGMRCSTFALPAAAENRKLLGRAFTKRTLGRRCEQKDSSDVAKETEREQRQG